MRLSRWLGVVCFAAAALFASGCSTVKEELKPAALTPIETTVKLVSQWRRETGASLDARYARLQPVELDGVIYVVGVNGAISAWRADDGHRLWKSSLRTAIGGGVGIYGDTGFVGTLDGHVIAFNLADGVEKWRAKSSSEILSAPQANGKVVIAPAIDGRVFAFDFATGKVLWNYDHPTPVLTLRSTAAPLVQENSAFVAFDNGQILHFDSGTGQLRWSSRVGQPQGKTELERIVDVDSMPLEYGPYIYGAGYNGRLIAISRGTGRPAWTQDVSTAYNITASDNKVVVSEANSHIKAFDALSGTLLWENDKLHRRNTTAPVILGSVVFVVDGDGIAHGLSLVDGSLVARTKLGSKPTYAQPFVVDDSIYFFDISGRLAAYKMEQGSSTSSIWDLPTNRQNGPIATKFTGVKQTQ